MAQQLRRFDRIGEGIGAFSVRGKTLLIPIMNPVSSPLFGALFESHGVKSRVLETYKGLEWGKQHTSGKECFPCQVTLGDILYFLQEERDRIGSSFNSQNYSVFFPGADGPCRFGMYTKFQRIVLDTYPEFRNIQFVCLSTESGYSINGLIEASRTRDLRKMGYAAAIIGDMLERLLWRTRPYEKEPGLADRFMTDAGEKMAEAFRLHGRSVNFTEIYKALEGIFSAAPEIVDPSIPQKPLVGIVGEIYLRTHVESNQHIIRLLERYGAEVVNASIGEWINYTTQDRLWKVRKDFGYSLGRLDFPEAWVQLGKLAKYGGDALYQQFRQKSLYKLARGLLPLRDDHMISELEKKLRESGIFGFQVPGEAGLSIAGALAYREHHYDGVVNVYPFTCMPSTVTSSILKPWFHERKFPYMDAPYDDSYQPGREAAIRTFMYQAKQHFERKSGNNGKGHGTTR